MKVYTLFQQNKKKLLGNSLDAGIQDSVSAFIKY